MKTIENKINSLLGLNELKDFGMTFHYPKPSDQETAFYEIGTSISFNHAKAITFRFATSIPDAIQADFPVSEDRYLLPFPFTTEGCRKFSKAHILPAQSFLSITDDMRLDEVNRCRNFKNRISLSNQKVKKVSFFIGTGDHSENMALLENGATMSPFVYPLWHRLATGCNGKYSQISTAFSNSLITFERVSAYHQTFFFLQIHYLPYRWDSPLVEFARHSPQPFFKHLPHNLPMDCIGFLLHISFGVLESIKTLEAHLQNGRDFVLYPLSLMANDENGKTDKTRYRSTFLPYINSSNAIVRNFIAFESFFLCPELHEDCKKVGLNNEVIEAIKNEVN